METKKIYEQPQTEEIKIATSQILCASTPGGGGSPTPSPRFVEDDEL